ncbi:MAG: hypothetical protein Q8O04_05215 [Deltaproteobacteria bacterium]|nr:hypothetical protein [Deltaproteobacteria bacterium]
MKKIFFLAIVLIFCGCSAKIATIHNLAPTSNIQFEQPQDLTKIRGIKRVAIFPLADYSSQQPFIKPVLWGENLITEELANHLVSHNLQVAVQEDVNTLLISCGIIKTVLADDLRKNDNASLADLYERSMNAPTTPEYELANGKYSDSIKKELRNIVQKKYANMSLSAGESPIRGAAKGLSKENIVKLGQTLGVDLIIRGRILQFGYKIKPSSNPASYGLIPLIIKPITGVLFGFAGETYDTDLGIIDNTITGAGVGSVVGGALGKNASTHYWGGTVSGAGIGAGLGMLSALHNPKDMTNVIELRLYAQDAKTGKILWSNRVGLEYVPDSPLAFDARHPYTAFSELTQKAISMLMADLFKEPVEALK